MPLTAITLCRGIDMRPEGADCENCGLSECPFVPGDGPDTARIVICGEAPGDTEVAKGIPFVGRAGQLLDAVLQEVGIDRNKECYITNACLCRPIPHRTPKAKEISACRQRLIAEIKSRAPELVLVLGAVALRAVLKKASIAAERGFIVWSSELEAWVASTYHPAAVLRKPGLYIDLVKDIRRAVQVLEKPPATPYSVDDLQYVLIETRNDVDMLVERLAQVGDIALDTEVASDGSILCSGISWRSGTAVVVTEKALKDSYTREQLGQAIQKKTIIGHNLKYDLQVLWRYGIRGVKTGFDTMLAHYTIDERRGTHSLKKLAREYFNAPDYAKDIKMYIDSMENCPKDIMYRYNAADVSYTYALAEVLQQKLDSNGRKVLTELLHPASDVLAEMEYLGVMVDVNYLAKLDKELSKEITDLEKQLYETAGREFNPNSPKQLVELLYHELELPVPGRLSTDVDALKAIAQYHPLPGLLLKYRDRKKFHSTYVTSLREAADNDNRVHTTFNLHGTVTGRLSSSNPINLQNIPRESDARNIFVATPGYTLVQGDLSQAEVRVLAWFCKDKGLIEALSAGGDMHIRTACLMFKKKPEEVTDKLRTAAKRLTFGIIYQMSVHSLADELSITATEAEELIEKFFSAFPKARDWIKLVQDEVMRTGKITTPFGRTRRFDFVTRENRNSVLRQAANTPIQSVASDITLKALIRLGRKLKGSDDTRMLLTVHDSIVLETKEDVQEVSKMLHAELCRPVLDNVPLKADIKVGQRWGSLKDIEF